MKRASSGPDDSKPRKGGIKWDEDNLEENERIKKELNPRKIDEPKTPYLSPQATEDEAEMLEDGVSPLSLNDTIVSPSEAGHAVHALRTHKSPWSDSSDQNGGSPSPRAPNGNIANGVGDRSASRSPRFSEDYYQNSSSDEEDDEDEIEELNFNGEIGGGGGSASSRKMKKSEKRKKFQEARKAHYGMKEALQKAKELLEKEVELEEGDDDELLEEQNGNV